MGKDEKEILIANISEEIVSGLCLYQCNDQDGQDLIWYTLWKMKGVFYLWCDIDLSAECFLLLDGENLRLLSFQGGAEYNII